MYRISEEIKISLQTGATECGCVYVTVWGSHDSHDSYCRLSGIYLPMFQRNLLPPSSR
jgi:hypothetical protein